MAMQLNIMRRTFGAGAGKAGRFLRDERASLSVEAVLITPMLLWAFLATYTFFDVYRHKNLSLKANYAVSDLLSRENRTINMNYLDGTLSLFRYLTHSDNTSWLRVTVVDCVEDCTDTGTGRKLSVIWSKATGGNTVFTNADVTDKLGAYVPLIASGERAIVVETSMHYDAPFSAALTGIGDRTFNDFVVTRPRFGPQLCFEGIGCGA